MYRFICVLLISLGCQSCFRVENKDHLTSAPSILVPDGAMMIVDKGQKDLPKNFRTLFHHPLFLNTTAPALMASGSAQPTRTQFKKVFENIRSHLKQYGEDPKSPIYIVDLRLEPHGYYGNELITIFERKLWEDFDALSMEKYEEKLFQHLKDQNTITLYRDIEKQGVLRVSKSQDIVLDGKDKLLTEKEYVKMLGGHYVRLAVRDHTAPTLDVLKQFFDFMETLPKNAWVHFHCSAGRGRTSTFLFLYDLYKRRPTRYDTFEDMAKRHHDAGSIDFFDSKDTFQKGDREKRLNLLKTAFHQRRQYHSS